MKLHLKTPIKFLKSMLYLLLAITVLTPLIPSALVSAQVCSESYLKNRQVAILNCSGENECEVPADANIGRGGQVSTTFNLGSDPLERRVNLVQALMNDYDLTAEQAAGIVGNFMHESAGTASVAEGVPPDVNQGETQGAPPKFSGGYGWAQWTGGRQRTFIGFAVANGYMGSQSEHATDAANYAYLRHELESGYTNTITQLRNQTSPEAAARSFEATFERAGVPALTERESNARQVYDEHRARGGGTGGSNNSADCEAEGGGAVVGGFAFPLNVRKSQIDNPNMFQNGTADRGGHPYIAYDILIGPGAEVVAAMGGTVGHIGNDRCGGRLISITNPNGAPGGGPLTITYMHLNNDPSSHVAEGATVEPGDHVGFVGSAADGCTVAHLHIDAIRGDTRLGCSRLNCPASTQALFVDIGAQLFETFQALPD